MTTSDLAVSIAAHVQHMLDLKQAREEAVQRKREANQAWEKAGEQVAELDQQLANARSVLDHCISTGEDPIVVRLSMEKSDLDQLDKNMEVKDQIIDRISKARLGWNDHVKNSILDDLRIGKTW
jgi:hypothetical protein